MAKQCRMCKRLDINWYWPDSDSDEIEYCECELKETPGGSVSNELFDCDKAILYKDEKRRSHACELWDEIYGDIE